MRGAAKVKADESIKDQGPCGIYDILRRRLWWSHGSVHASLCVECGHGVPYAVAAHPEPASPCRTIPCNPSPGGTSHVSYTTSGSYLHRGPTYLRYPYPTDHCRDWVICVPRYRTLGFGSITPR